MSKETKEAFVLGAQVTNGIFEVAEDGKVNLNDLQTAIRVILGAQKGVEGFELIGSEQDTIGSTEKAEIRRAMVEEMRKIPAVDRDDFADVYMGILSGYRLGRRRGKKEATQAILKALKEKGPAAVIAELEAA